MAGERQQQMVEMKMELSGFFTQIWSSNQEEQILKAFANYRTCEKKWTRFLLDDQPKEHIRELEPDKDDLVLLSRQIYPHLSGLFRLIEDQVSELNQIKQGRTKYVQEMEESRKQTEKYPTREAIDVEKKVLTEIGEQIAQIQQIKATYADKVVELIEGMKLEVSALAQDKYLSQRSEHALSEVQPQNQSLPIPEEQVGHDQQVGDKSQDVEVLEDTDSQEIVSNFVGLAEHEEMESVDNQGQQLLVVAEVKLQHQIMEEPTYDTLQSTLSSEIYRFASFKCSGIRKRDGKANEKKEAKRRYCYYPEKDQIGLKRDLVQINHFADTRRVKICKGFQLVFSGMERQEWPQNKPQKKKVPEDLAVVTIVGVQYPEDGFMRLKVCGLKMQDRKGKDSFEIGNMNPTCPYPGSSPKIKKITLEPGEKIVGIKYRENPERKYIQIDTEFTFIIAKALDLQLQL